MYILYIKLTFHVYLHVELSGYFCGCLDIFVDIITSSSCLDIFVAMFCVHYCMRVRRYLYICINLMLAAR